MNQSEFIRAMPKAELHSHLDGGLRTVTIIELAKKFGVELPTYDPAIFAETVFKDRYANLVELLKLFDLSLKLMRTPESLERTAYEFVQDYIAEGVLYLEARFAPQLHVCDKLPSMEQILEIVNKGMKRAADEYNNSPDVVAKKKPQFRYGIISCMIRSLGKGVAEYYDRVLDLFSYSGHKAAKVHAGMELVLATIQARDRLKVPIVAIDLAGGEYGNPCEDFAEPFALAHANMFNVTIHAGEAAGPESIYNAVLRLGAQRIGHGLHMFDHDDKVDSEKVIEYLAKERIGVEVCVTSNMQTCTALTTLRDHPVNRMIKRGVCVCMACDNKAISKTDLSKEIGMVAKEFALTPSEIKELAMNSFEKAFFPGTHKEKQEYISEIRKYYEELEAKFNKGK